MYGAFDRDEDQVLRSGSIVEVSRLVHTENSVRINQHTCGTLIADLVDALSL